MVVMVCLYLSKKPIMAAMDCFWKFEDNFYYETLPSRKIQEVSDPKKTLEPKLPKTLSEAPTALGDKVSSWKEIDTQ